MSLWIVFRLFIEQIMLQYFFSFLFCLFSLLFVFWGFYLYSSGSQFLSSTVSILWICYCWSVTQSCPTVCDSAESIMPGFSVLHYLQELAQTHVHWVIDAIQPFHPLSSPSPPAFNLFQHQGFFFLWVSPSYQVAKVLELQLQHQSFQWTIRVDFL